MRYRPLSPVPGYGRDRYGYNEWGELTARRDQQLEWNAQGQLTRVISGNTETHYGYDALGRRTRKATYERHTGHTEQSRTVFVWEGFRLLQENVQQQGWRTYLYDAEQPYTAVACATGRGESRQVWYYHTDVTGTPQEVTAADGMLVWAGYIRGFGENAADISGSGAYFHQPLRLPGQYFDDETGLHYNLFRYYAPECGRFVSQDPISIRGGLNLYAYCPNPLTWIDPLGLDWNYYLTNSSGDIYYHGRASDNASLDDVMRRHNNNVGADGNARFGEGDSIHRTTPVGTDYDIVRGVENSGIREKDILGRNSNNVRGNLIQGISDEKLKTPEGMARVAAANKHMAAHGASTASELRSLESKTYSPKARC